MTDNDNDTVPLIEGDDAPPDITLNPVDGDDPDTDDLDMDDPQNLPPESFEADESDDKGKEAGV
jgi:hypothetical protein